MRPSNHEAEKTVLGAFFQFEDIRDKIVMEVNSAMFDNQVHKALYLEGLKIYQDKADFSFHACINRLPNYSYILLNCLDIIPSSTLVVEFIDELKKEYRNRQLWYLQENIRQALKDKVEAQKIIKATEIRLLEIDGGKSNIIRLGDLCADHESKEKYIEMTTSCIKSGISQFDKLLNINQTDFIIIAGRPSHGKSAFGIFLAKSYARHNYGVGILSLEMPNNILMLRMAMSEGQYSGYDGYRQGIGKIATLPIFFEQFETNNIHKIENTISILKKKHNIKLVIIDYLGLIGNDESNKKSLYESVTELSQRLKISAKKNQIPHFVLAQLSREPDKRTNHRPMLSDIRDSGGIEQDSDIVMFTYSPGMYENNKNRDEFKDVDLNTYFEIVAAKQRNGALGVIKFFNDKSKSYYAPLEVYQEPKELF